MCETHGGDSTKKPRSTVSRKTLRKGAVLLLVISISAMLCVPALSSNVVTTNEDGELKNNYDTWKKRSDYSEKVLKCQEALEWVKSNGKFAPEESEKGFDQAMSLPGDKSLREAFRVEKLLGILAQRLVRRLCPNCKTASHPSAAEIKEIITEYGKRQFHSSGIEITPDLKIFKPKGCDACANIGYSGRVAIHEMLQNTDEMKLLIKKKEGSEVIAQTAANQGMTTLKQDGILKVFDGLTDLSEVRRVCIK